MGIRLSCLSHPDEDLIQRLEILETPGIAVSFGCRAMGTYARSKCMIASYEDDIFHPTKQWKKMYYVFKTIFFAIFSISCMEGLIPGKVPPGSFRQSEPFCLIELDDKQRRKRL